MCVLLQKFSRISVFFSFTLAFFFAICCNLFNGRIKLVLDSKYKHYKKKVVVVVLSERRVKLCHI